MSIFDDVFGDFGKDFFGKGSGKGSPVIDVAEVMKNIGNGRSVVVKEETTTTTSEDGKTTKVVRNVTFTVETKEKS